MSSRADGRCASETVPQNSETVLQNSETVLQNSETLLRIRGLHVSYPSARGPVRALRGVDLDCHAGTVLGLAGESGCGKSTLASTILRVQAPAAQVSGQVLLDGED